MLRGVWRALNCLSIRATYCVIIAGTSPGETKMWAAVRTWKRRFFNCYKLHNFCCHNRFSCLITVCSICTWTSCLRILTKSPAIPQQLYKPASRGLSAIAELLVTYRNNLMWIITKIRNPWHSVKLNYVVVAYFNSSILWVEFIWTLFSFSFTALH